MRNAPDIGFCPRHHIRPETGLGIIKVQRIADLMADFDKVPESWLFVPCRERFLSSPEKLKNADNLIYDLEDSLKPSEKEEGLKLLCASGRIRPSKEQRIYVRLNKDRLETEIKALNGLDIDGFMIPKFEGTEDLKDCGELIGKKSIVPLVETCKGIVNLERFADDERIPAIALGGEDYCSSLGVSTNDDALFAARSRLVLYAKAAGKNAVDTVSTQFADRTLFEEELKKSARFGFDGKLMIHPAQAEVSKSLWRAIPQDAISSIIKEFEARKEGAVMINGSLYERPHIERLKKLIKGE